MKRLLALLALPAGLLAQDLVITHNPLFGPRYNAPPARVGEEVVVTTSQEATIGFRVCVRYLTSSAASDSTTACKLALKSSDNEFTVVVFSLGDAAIVQRVVVTPFKASGPEVAQ